ncbi:MAG: hypothetical protein MH137_06145 [Flavobacteriales bacterium]|nr:hypothetical protein [Flavobacteriales bacterium]
MSIIHKIIGNTPLDFEKLNLLIKNINGAAFSYRDDGSYYYWIENHSTRGVDLTPESDYIEIRNTLLSNIHDYELTNKLVSQIKFLTNGIVLNEDDEPVEGYPLFKPQFIEKQIQQDCNIVQALLGLGEEITIYGTKRKVHFGKHIFNKWKDLSGENLTKAIFDLIEKVNYYIPDYDYGQVIQVGDDDEPKFIKLITNAFDCIVDKYDYIMLHNEEDEAVMITNDILNTILPEEWQRVDEYTLVAPIIKTEHWEKLLASARQLNIFEEYLKNTK